MYKYLAIQGAGVGLYAYVGWMIQNKESIITLDEVSGSSAGAIIALLWGLGWDPQRILEASLSVDLKRASEYSISNLFSTYGFMNYTLIRETILNVIGFDPMFKDLKRKIHIAAYCLNKRTTHTFSVDSHPEMSVIDAAIMSLSIPLVIGAFKYNGNYYIDGSFGEEWPITPFLNKNPDHVIQLGIELHHTPADDKINSLRRFLTSFLISITTIRHKDYTNFKTFRIKMENNFNCIDFSIDYESKVKLVLLGSTAK